MKKMPSKKVHLVTLFIVLFTCIFSLLSFSYAVEFKTTNNSVSMTGKDIYVAGQNLNQSEMVRGDYIAAGQDIKVTSETVDGDILLAAQNIFISSKVAGNVRSAGQSVTISGEIAKNLNVFAQNAIINKATINKNVLIFAETSNVSGKMIGDVTIFSNNAELQGDFSGEVYVETGNNGTLTIKPGTKIVGKITHKGSAKAIVANDVDASKINWIKTNYVEKKHTQKDEPNILLKYMKMIISIFIYFFIGLILIKLFPKALNMQVESISTHPFRVLGNGFLTIVIGVGLVIATIILLILSIWLYSPSIPMVFGTIFSSFYVIIAFLATIPVSVWFGNLIFRDKLKPAYSFLIALLSIKIVMIIFSELTKISVLFGVLHFLLYATILLFGIGAIIISLKKVFGDVLKLQKD